MTYRELDERSNALANAWRERWAAGRGRRRDPGSQPPRLPRRGVRRGQVRRADRAAQHVVRRLRRSARSRAVRGPTCSSTTTSTRRCSRGSSRPHGRWRAWTEPEDCRTPSDTLEALIARGSTAHAPPKPATGPKIVILTSGTTGTPKGAPRSEPRSLSVIGGLLEQGAVPRPRGDRAVRADVPRARVRAHGARAGARLDARRPAALRPRGRRSTASSATGRRR